MSTSSAAISASVGSRPRQVDHRFHRIPPSARRHSPVLATCPRPFLLSFMPVCPLPPSLAWRNAGSTISDSPGRPAGDIEDLETECAASAAQWGQVGIPEAAPGRCRATSRGATRSVTSASARHHRAGRSSRPPASGASAGKAEIGPSKPSDGAKAGARVAASKVGWRVRGHTAAGRRQREAPSRRRVPVPAPPAGPARRTGTRRMS